MESAHWKSCWESNAHGWEREIHRGRARDASGRPAVTPLSPPPPLPRTLFVECRKLFVSLRVIPKRRGTVSVRPSDFLSDSVSASQSAIRTWSRATYVEMRGPTSRYAVEWGSGVRVLSGLDSVSISPFGSATYEVNFSGSVVKSSLALLLVNKVEPTTARCSPSSFNPRSASAILGAFFEPRSGPHGRRGLEGIS